MSNFNSDRNSRGGRRGGYGRGDRRDKQMFETVCSNCGKNCKVPFRPTGEKPVYCSDCFEKLGDRSKGRSFDKSRRDERKPRDDQYRVQIDTINTKLDQILSLLQSKPEPEFAPRKRKTNASTKEKEIKSMKPKKSTKKKTSKK